MVQRLRSLPERIPFFSGDPGAKLAKTPVNLVLILAFRNLKALREMILLRIRIYFPPSR